MLSCRAAVACRAVASAKAGRHLALFFLQADEEAVAKHRTPNAPAFNIERPIKLPAEGLEPTRPCGHWILSPARLPVPPRRRLGNGAKEYEVRAEAQTPPITSSGCKLRSGRGF